MTFCRILVCLQIESGTQKSNCFYYGDTQKHRPTYTSHFISPQHQKVFLLLRAPSLQFFFLCLLSLDLWSGNGNIQFTRFLWKTNLAEIVYVRFWSFKSICYGFLIETKQHINSWRKSNKFWNAVCTYQQTISNR